MQSSTEDVITLLCAYTGTAAFNINGMTLHSAFQLHSRGISDERNVTSQRFVVAVFFFMLGFSF